MEEVVQTLNGRSSWVDGLPSRKGGLGANVSACADCAKQSWALCSTLNERIEQLNHGSAVCRVRSSVQTILPRRTICHQKESMDYVPAICRGWASSSIVLPDGRRQILSFLLPGDFVSSTALFEPVWGRLIESITDVTYRNFRRDELKAFIFSDRELFEEVTRVWSAEKKHADRLAVDLGRRTADERIAGLILDLFERLTKRGLATGASFVFPLRQRHVADATGLTPVHVSKVIGQFQKTDLIVINDRQLDILDMARLQRLAGRQ